MRINVGFPFNMTINQGLLPQYGNQSLIHTLYGDQDCMLKSYKNQPCILKLYGNQPWNPASTRKPTTDSQPYVGINHGFPYLNGNKLPIYTPNQLSIHVLIQKTFLHSRLYTGRNLEFPIYMGIEHGFQNCMGTNVEFLLLFGKRPVLDGNPQCEFSYWQWIMTLCTSVVEIKEG